MPLAALNRPLIDLGGVPVLWDSDRGTLVQDPTQGGTNSYGPGDLFRDPANGDVYQLKQDGSLGLYQVAVTAPTVPSTPAGVGAGVSSAAGSWTGRQSGGSSTAAITATGNATQFGHQVVAWLSKASFFGGMPNGVLVMGGALAYMFVRQRRRRNPWYVRRTRTRDRSQRAEMFGDSQVGREGYSRTYPTQRAAEREAAAWRSTEDWSADVVEGRAPRRKRNPSGGARVVYNRLLGGWYVVIGRHQAPISGRFDTKAEALAWLKGRRRNPGKRRRARRAKTAAFQSRLFLFDRGKPRRAPAEDARNRRQRHRERGFEARAYRADRDAGMAPF